MCVSISVGTWPRVEARGATSRSVFDFKGHVCVDFGRYLARGGGRNGGLRMNSLGRDVEETLKALIIGLGA